MKLAWGRSPFGGFQGRRLTRSRSGWRGDIDLVPLEPGSSSPRRAMFITSKLPLEQLSITSLSFPFAGSGSAITPLEKRRFVRISLKQNRSR
jgi:hypothetical protein